jgi:anti-sigma factor RsiW
LPKRLLQKPKIAPWAVASLAATQLCLLPVNLSLAASSPPAAVAAAAVPGAANGSWSLEFLADASGVMSLLMGNPEMQDVGPQAISAFIESAEEALEEGEPAAAGMASARKRTGLDPAGRPCYSRLLCGAVYVAAAPDLSLQ